MQLWVLLLSSLCVTCSAVKLTSVRRWLSSAGICALSQLGPMISFADYSPTPWDPAVKYEIVTKAPTDAVQPKVGDLVAIRFRGEYKGNAFDDTFKTDQPYFYRAGVGLLVKGLDDAIVQMKVGDQWKLQFGGNLAFGEKGKPSSPGKPRIPPNAEISFEVNR
jgi:peptidylprolyl isomerase